MREIIIALVSSTITVAIASSFNYFYLIKKELRIQANAYKIEILQKIYTPIYKTILEDVYPGDGYDGISLESFFSIDSLVKENYQIASPELDRIIWSIKEYIAHYHPSNYTKELDQDKELLSHVEYNFNYYKKELGLPYDKVQYREGKKKVKKEHRARELQRKKFEKKLEKRKKRDIKEERKEAKSNE